MRLATATRSLSEETAMGDEGWAVLWLASPIVMLWMLWVAGGGV